MPTYEYQCESCGHHFEAFQSITEAPFKKCPRCKGPVKRLISPGAGLIFKGSGFYITDYKKSSASPASGSAKQESEKPKSDPGGAKDKSSDKKNNS